MPTDGVAIPRIEMPSEPAMKFQPLSVVLPRHPWALPSSFDALNL